MRAGLTWSGPTRLPTPTTGGVVPPSTIASIVKEEGQPAAEVGPVVAKIAPNAPSSILAKRNRDDMIGSSG